jgi:hypothetical protein
VAAIRSESSAKTFDSGARLRGSNPAEAGNLRKQDAGLVPVGKDPSAEGASALGSGSGGALSAEGGLRGTGQLVSPRRAGGKARATGRRRDRSNSFDRTGGATGSVSGRFRRVRVSAEQAGADFDRAMGARSTRLGSGPGRGRRDEPQLAAAAPTAPRLEAEVAGGESRRRGGANAVQALREPY